MIVLNKTKSILTFPIDHKGNQVAAAYPGWSEIPDSNWFAREHKITDKAEIERYAGEIMIHGAEVTAVNRIESGELEILGEVEELLEGQISQDGQPAARGRQGSRSAKAAEATQGSTEKRVRRSLTLSEVPVNKAREVINGCNRSDLLKQWKTGVPDVLAIEINNRLDTLRDAAEKARQQGK